MCVLRTGLDVAGGKELQGVLPVPAQQHVVKLGLDLAVRHPAFPDEPVHKGVAGAVQRKVAHKAQCVGKRRLPVRRLLHHLPCPVKELSAWLVVHGIAQGTYRVGLGGVVVEQQIRSVETDIVQRSVFADPVPQLRGQMIQYVCAKTAVRIS